LGSASKLAAAAGEKYWKHTKSYVGSLLDGQFTH
jgi:hypothetical protein